ncbi:MAG: oxidoreductase [Rhodospirillales bacterium]|jgi:acrylyl-CoA reductase (NADPH)|nr:oxidoreductase [Rhodospirillales bacterium]
MPGDFRALVLEQNDGNVTAAIKNLPDEALPPGDVTVRVAYSDLNYKDGMILKGLGRLVRTYPHVPGIDFAGVVEESSSSVFKPGDEVVLTGWRVGEIHWGGYAERARVKSEWLVPLPPNMTMRQAMALGTAGLTAMLAVMALENHGLKPDNRGDVLVTGASGGVGSVATAVLARLGFRVAAVTGRAESHEYLKALGATAIVDRAELDTPPKGPLAAERWSGAIDSVGGTTLANILASLCYWSSCAAVGNAGGVALNTTVIPFLLRGINLLGIDSATCPTERRLLAWQRLAKDLPLAALDAMTDVVPLSQLPEKADEILKGQIRGRTVVDLSA